MISGMDAVSRNNVTGIGEPDAQVVVLAHGFGCAKNTSCLVSPMRSERLRLVLFDYVGSGHLNPPAGRPEATAQLIMAFAGATG